MLLTALSDSCGTQQERVQSERDSGGDTERCGHKVPGGEHGNAGCGGRAAAAAAAVDVRVPVRVLLLPSAEQEEHPDKERGGGAPARGDGGHRERSGRQVSQR